MTRNERIDILKGIGILAVVAGHALNTDVFPSAACDVARKILYVFHLPIFFFCSGYLFNEAKGFSAVLRSVSKKYIDFLKICLGSLLLLPLWVWLDCMDLPRPSELALKAIRIFVFRPSGIFVSAIWFVPCLCLAQTMFWCYLRAGTSKLMTWGLLAAFAIVGIWVNANGIFHYYNLNAAILMVPVMMVGKQCQKRASTIKTRPVMAVGGAAGALVIIALLNSLTNNEIDLSKGIIYGGGEMFYPVVLTGLLLCCCMANLIEGNTVAKAFFCKMGEHSLYIMAFHFVVFKIFDGLWHLCAVSETTEQVRLWPISHPEYRWAYAIIGIALPIALREAYIRKKQKV